MRLDITDFPSDPKGVLTRNLRETLMIALTTASTSEARCEKLEEVLKFACSKFKEAKQAAKEYKAVQAAKSQKRIKAEQMQASEDAPESTIDEQGT